MKLKLISFVFYALCCVSLFAQRETNPIVTLQSQIDVETINAKVIPCGNHGVIVAYSAAKGDKNDTAYFDWYDVRFTLQKSIKIPNLQELRMDRYLVQGSEVYFLFTNFIEDVSEFQYPIFSYYKLIRINLLTKEYELIAGDLEDFMQMVDFDIVDGKMAFVGHTYKVSSKNTALTVLVDLNAKNSPTHGRYQFKIDDANKVSIYSDIAFNSDKILLVAQEFKGKQALNYLQQIDKNQEISYVKLDCPENVFPRDAHIQNFADNKQLIVALTGSPTSNSLEYPRNDGMVIWEVKNGTQMFMSEIKYKRFRNFEIQSDYSERVAVDSLKVNSLLNVSHLKIHQIVESDDGYLIFGEYYEPTKCIANYSFYSTVNASLKLSSNGVNCGNNSIAGFILKINKSGKFLWDYGFISQPYSQVSRIDTKRFFFYNYDVNAFKLVFPASDKLNSVVIDSKGISNKMASENINLPKNGKDLSNPQGTYPLLNGVEFWYDNYGISFSISIVKKEKHEEGRKYSTYFNLTKFDYTKD